MRELAFAFDCDDVLYQTAPESIKWFNERYGSSLALEDMFKMPTIEKYGTRDIKLVLGRVAEFNSTMACNLPVLDGAQESLERIRSEVGRLHVVTGRSESSREVTTAVLDRDFPGIFDSIEFTDSLNPEAARTKPEVCYELGVSAIADDLFIKNLGEGTEQMLFGNYPWNRNVEPSAGRLVYCANWNDVEREVARIAGR